MTGGAEHTSTDRPNSKLAAGPVQSWRMGKPSEAWWVPTDKGHAHLHRSIESVLCTYLHPLPPQNALLPCPVRGQRRLSVP